MLPPLDPKTQAAIETISSMIASDKAAMDKLSSMVQSGTLEAKPKINALLQAAMPPPQKSAGHLAYDRLVAQITEFELQLNAQEEIGAYLVSAPGAEVFHMENLKFRGDLIIFEGKNVHGRPLQLVQHYTQVSILLTALPVQPEAEAPRRIGFMLEQKLSGSEESSP